MRRVTYIVSTLGYGLVALLSFVLFFSALLVHRWLLASVCLIALLVALDNFLCGSRAKACGYTGTNHYVFPPFFRKNKP